MREFAWGRVLIASAGLGLIAGLLAAATGISIGRSTVVLLAATGLWFVVLTVTYGLRLKREGVVEFPAPWWRADPRSD